LRPSFHRRWKEHKGGNARVDKGVVFAIGGDLMGAGVWPFAARYHGVGGGGSKWQNNAKQGQTFKNPGALGVRVICCGGLPNFLRGADQESSLGKKKKKARGNFTEFMFENSQGEKAVVRNTTPALAE